MNQKILIVFTLFLLITILLLLLFSDAKAKSSRIKVIVILFGHPVDSTIMDTINSFLDRLASENNFVFAMADHVEDLYMRFPESQGVLLELQSVSFVVESNEKELNSDGNGTIQIDIGRDAAHCSDPDFLVRVRDTILRVASGIPQGK